MITEKENDCELENRKLTKGIAGMVRDAVKLLSSQEIQKLIDSLEQEVAKRAAKEGPVATDVRVEPETSAALREAMENQTKAKKNRKKYNGLLWKDYPVRIRPINSNTDWGNSSDFSEKPSLAGQGLNYPIENFVKDPDTAIEAILSLPEFRRSGRIDPSDRSGFRYYSWIIEPFEGSGEEVVSS